MGSASLLLFAVVLRLVNVALMDRTGVALDFLAIVGDAQSKLTISADPSRASSSHGRIHSMLQQSASDICTRLCHLLFLGIAVSEKNSARVAACIGTADVKYGDIHSSVVDASIFSVAVGHVDVDRERTTGVQCSNTITSAFVGQYKGNIFWNYKPFRRSVYDVCRTLEEVIFMVPASNENELRRRGCVCIKELANAYSNLNLPTRESYTYTIVDLAVYDYLEELGKLVARSPAAIGRVDINHLYSEDVMAKRALQEGAFQKVCANLATYGRTPSATKEHRARLDACESFFPRQ